MKTIPPGDAALCARLADIYEEAQTCLQLVTPRLDDPIENASQLGEWEALTYLVPTLRFLGQHGTESQVLEAVNTFEANLHMHQTRDAAYQRTMLRVVRQLIGSMLQRQNDQAI